MLWALRDKARIWRVNTVTSFPAGENRARAGQRVSLGGECYDITPGVAK